MEQLYCVKYRHTLITFFPFPIQMPCFLLLYSVGVAAAAVSATTNVYVCMCVYVRTTYSKTAPPPYIYMCMYEYYTIVCTCFTYICILCYISQFFSHIIVHMIYACIHHNTQVSTIFHTFWLYIWHDIFIFLYIYIFYLLNFLFFTSSTRAPHLSYNVNENFPLNVELLNEFSKIFIGSIGDFI